NNEAVSFAQALNEAGYRTAYIGKWHLDGHGRSNFIPPERRQGFRFWRAQECTHDYNKSAYFAQTDAPFMWDGYDAIAQTREAQRYLREDVEERPFALFLSWGPPHNPYETAPEEYRALYDPERLELRPNVPEAAQAAARRDLAGYYAHCTALDACVGNLLDTLRDLGLDDNTVFVFTSDHGDMLGSQGEQRKQRPWDESIRVPLLVRYPARLGRAGRVIEHPISTPDLMPTLLALCGVDPPATVEGRDFSGHLNGGPPPDTAGALIACYSPFGEWTREKGGREYRGLRTARHTYVRSLDGPWLFFDNARDPYQQRNLCGVPEHEALRQELDAALSRVLEERGDAFLPGDDYVARWSYRVDASGTVPYAP
ncbi:MAG TPA: sulfatase, partial [Candidatus Hydrogenedentes bacterium]|nr:sulfatase [Candidatus Hydrogenedentota bacterium]